MHLFLDGMLAERGKTFADKMDCPFMLCPSNYPVEGRHKSKMKFIQKISPRVYQYRCGWCHNLINRAFDGPNVPEEMFAQNLNPKLVSNKPSFSLMKW